ncbi:MAG: hypothetical protein RLZZ501_2173 [Pseudomonadota bacterium]|jgi:hypothetical protein
MITAGCRFGGSPLFISGYQIETTAIDFIRWQKVTARGRGATIPDGASSPAGGPGVRLKGDE